MQCQEYNGEKIVSSKNSVGETGIHTQQNEVEHFSYIQKLTKKKRLKT